MVTTEKIERLRKLARRVIVGEVLLASQIEDMSRIALEMADEAEKSIKSPCDKVRGVTI